MALRSFRELSSAGLLVVEAAPTGLTDRSRPRCKLHSPSLEAGVPLNAASVGLYSVSVREGLAMERINIADKFARFSEQWQPKIVAELNGQELKLVKVQGTFPWHRHDDVEEMFLVW